MYPDDSDYHMLFTDDGSIFIHRDWRERFKKSVLELGDQPATTAERMLIVMGACIHGGIERAELSPAKQANAFMHWVDEEFKKKPDWSDTPEKPKPKNIGDGPRLLDL